MNYSVVIPAFNAGKTLPICLGSVALQTLRPIEVLVVDDCSTDDTAIVVHDFMATFTKLDISLKYIAQTYNQGPSAARNRGMLGAVGDFVAFLDADDQWVVDKLEIVDKFTTITGIGLLCHTYTDVMPIQKFTSDLCHEQLTLYHFLLRNRAQTSCAVIRNNLLWQFDSSMRYSEDLDLWLRIAETALVINIFGRPLTILGRPQLSAGGLSGSRTRMRIGEMKSYFRFCSRGWFPRFLLLPLLLAYSLVKYLRQEINRL